MTELDRLGLEIARWSDRTFGYNRHPNGCIAHLQEEVAELKKEPGDLMEYADCLMLLLDAARQAGYTPEHLVNATWAKLDINRQRKWGEVNEEGYIKHIA